jgi:hypothetical protein
MHQAVEYELVQLQSEDPVPSLQGERAVPDPTRDRSNKALFQETTKAEQQAAEEDVAAVLADVREVNAEVADALDGERYTASHAAHAAQPPGASSASTATAAYTADTAVATATAASYAAHAKPPGTSSSVTTTATAATTATTTAATPATATAAAHAERKPATKHALTASVPADFVQATNEPSSRASFESSMFAVGSGGGGSGGGSHGGGCTS